MSNKVIIILLFFLFLTGCTSSSKEDMLNYINVEITSISNIEQNALFEFEAALSKEDYTYKDLYDILDNKVIPTYSSFVEKLNKIAPKTEEVRRIHSFYIEGANLQLSALKTLAEGIAEKNNDKIESSYKLLNEAKVSMEVFKNESVLLADKYKIKYTLH